MDPLSTEVIRVASQVLGANVSVLPAAKAGLLATTTRFTAKTEPRLLAKDQLVINAFVYAVEGLSGRPG